MPKFGSFSMFNLLPFFHPPPSLVQSKVDKEGFKQHVYAMVLDFATRV